MECNRFDRPPPPRPPATPPLPSLPSQELELALLKAESDKQLLMLEVSQLKKLKEMDAKKEQQERKRMLREAKVRHAQAMCVFGCGKGVGVDGGVDV